MKNWEEEIKKIVWAWGKIHGMTDKEMEEEVTELESLVRAVVKEETRVKVTVKDKKMGMVLGKLLALYGSEFAAWIDKNTERLVAEFNQELADLERK